MKNSEWVDLKELANAIKCKPETLRRSCVSGRYTCRFNKNGKYKIYEILLSSLPDKLINKYLERHNPKNRELSINNQDYSDVPEWSSMKENSLLRNIGINVHFALPYNAQTKPVERDFLKVKTFLSKGFVGYRGGKITERPEKLKAEIKAGNIMEFDDFKKLFDDFIENYLNKKPSKGKVLQGRCPDQLWAEEFTNKKVISKDALKLFCMRTSKVVSIGRNGVYDSQLQLTYWGEWMICEKGRKVFIRRDINAYQEAWVFDAATEEYLGKANVHQAVSFLAQTNVEKEAYKKAIETKNKEKKILKSYIKCKYNPSNEDIINNLKNGLEQTEFNSTPKVSLITNTKMEQVITKEKQANKKQKLKYVAQTPIKTALYLTESQKRRGLAKQAM